MDRKKYVFEASDDVKKVIAMGVTRGGAIWTDTMDVENFEELNSDYINEHFSELQDTAYKKGLHDGESKRRYCNEYQRGLDDAWEVARKIVEMTDPPYWGVFNEYKSDLFGKITASEAIEKLKAYEEKQKADGEIKVGDEVIYNEHKFIVFALETEERYASLFDVNGRHASADHRECKKTGRHFDIDKILEEMKK